MNKLTFCVLAYKESPYLEECLQSLLKQKGKIIICTSTPNQYLANLAKKYNLPLNINQEKNGIASDWNFALNQAKTPYVTLAHQDDLYLPSYSEDIIKMMDEHPDSLLAFTGYAERVESEGKESFDRENSLNLIIKKIILYFQFGSRESISNKNQKLSLLKFGSPIPCPSVCYNKQNIGKFAFNQKLKINMDWFTWYQMAKMNGSFLFKNKMLMIHRIHQDSATSKGLIDNARQSEDKKMFELFWPKKISSFISYIYSLSYKSNNV